MKGDPIIELRDVNVPFRRDAEVTSLEAVNWTVREGDSWIVGGLQGSGKSDLMFMLAGLTKPRRGFFTLFGQDMTQHFGDEFLPCRLRVGMVFDDARLFNHLTIAENVSLPARYHNDLHVDEVESWLAALMKATDIAEFASNTPSILARHWRRRVALARALSLQPELLLLENPLRGLDWRHSAWWIDFVKQLWRGHDLMGGKTMTVVVSTDEFRPWRESAAQFATLEEKKFALNGDTAPEDDTTTPALAARVAEGATEGDQ
jgi:ABC-type transporter Mla maintaining outer membrane lipid asymmetry ATPase subunit MlaF